jgi:type I restriction enzyme M protein
MNGAHYADLRGIDSLSQLSSITGGIMKGLPEYPGFYPSGLTMVITNPPFGSVLSNSRAIEDLSSRDGVTKRGGKSVKSIPQEIAFLNRCLEYLAPHGRLASVIPDGVLANSSQQYVRDWILRWAKLKAIVSLPQATFAPFGAGVKTSIIVLEKRAHPLPATEPSMASVKKPRKRKKTATEGQSLFIEAEEENGMNGNGVTEQVEQPGQPVVDEDYEVYMARIDDIGYDAAGRNTVPVEQQSNPPEVQETIADFAKRSGW